MNQLILISIWFTGVAHQQPSTGCRLCICAFYTGCISHFCLLSFIYKIIKKILCIHIIFSQNKKSELSTSSQERDTMENCILLLHQNVRTYQWVLYRRMATESRRDLKLLMVLLLQFLLCFIFCFVAKLNRPTLPGRVEMTDWLTGWVSEWMTDYSTASTALPPSNIKSEGSEFESTTE